MHRYEWIGDMSVFAPVSSTADETVRETVREWGEGGGGGDLQPPHTSVIGVVHRANCPSLSTHIISGASSASLWLSSARTTSDCL